MIIDLKNIALSEYGYLPVQITAKWNQLPENKQNRCLVIGVNNADVKGLVWKEILKNAVDFLQAVTLVKEYLEIEKTYLYLPESMAAQAEELQAEAGQAIMICTGKIDVRAFQADTLYHHPETILALKKLADDKDAVLKRWIFCMGKSAQVPIHSTFEEVLHQFGVQNIVGVLDGGIAGRYVEKNKFQQKIGTWGSGEWIAVTDTDCLVYRTKEAMEYQYQNTCGKCTFCREGYYQMQAIMNDVVRGKSLPQDFEKLAELTELVPEQSLCSFGQCGINLMSQLIEDEMQLKSHIKGKKCPNEVCFQEGIRIAVRGDICEGCGKCKEVCPMGCIEGSPRFIHMIDEFVCNKCGLCMKVCPVQAIAKVSDEVAVGPERTTRVGRYLRTTRRELTV